MAGHLTRKKDPLDGLIVIYEFFGFSIFVQFLQGVSIALLYKPCTSYDRRRDAVRPSVRPSHAGTE